VKKAIFYAGKRGLILALLIGLCSAVFGQGQGEGQPQTQVQIPPQAQAQNPGGTRGRTSHPFIVSVDEDAIGTDVMINGDGVYVLDGFYNTSIYRYYGSQTRLVIPDSFGVLPVWKISDRAFEPTLDTDIISTTITKGDGKEVIGVFAPRRTKLTSVTLPKDLDEIGARAFANNSLSSIRIPESVEKIGANAFENNRITSLTLNGTDLEIGQRAFANNVLSFVDIPAGVKKISSGAFMNNRISRITLRGQDIDIAGDSFENGFSAFYNGNGKKPGYYMYGSVAGWSYLPLGQFKTTDGFSFLLCTDGNAKIAALYSYSGKEKNVHIPEEVDGVPVTRILYGVFYTGITGVSIPDSVTVIDNHAFSGNKLEEVTLPANLVTIGDNAFSDNKLTAIVIPRGVETIGSNAFSGNAIASVELGRALIAIGDSAFQDNDLTELVIPNSVETIGTNAFSGNELTYVDIGSSVVSIGQGAFKNNKLEDISIPRGVENIGADAFRANQITSIAIGGQVSLGNKAFDDTFNAYYNDCFKLPGLYYKGNMRDRWGGGFISKPHFLMDAGFGLEAGFGSAPWEASFFQSLNHIGVDARLGLGLGFDLLSFNMAAFGIGGTKFGKDILGFYGGGMGELYLYDGLGLAFGGGVFYGSFGAFDIEKMRTYPFLRGELIFRGAKHKFSLYGERYIGERWGFGLLWHVDG
jgi:hypothetical protein